MSFINTKLFKITKIFLYITILKRKRKNYNDDFDKLIVKMLRVILLTMFINKSLKILQKLITKNVLVF